MNFIWFLKTLIQKSSKLTVSLICMIFLALYLLNKSLVCSSALLLLVALTDYYLISIVSKKTPSRAKSALFSFFIVAVSLPVIGIILLVTLSLAMGPSSDSAATMGQSQQPSVFGAPGQYNHDVATAEYAACHADMQSQDNQSKVYNSGQTPDDLCNCVEEIAYHEATEDHGDAPTYTIPPLSDEKVRLNYTDDINECLNNPQAGEFPGFNN